MKYLIVLLFMLACSAPQTEVDKELEEVAAPAPTLDEVPPPTIQEMKQTMEEVEKPARKKKLPKKLPKKKAKKHVHKK